MYNWLYKCFLHSIIFFDSLSPPHQIKQLTSGTLSFISLKSPHCTQQNVQYLIDAQQMCWLRKSAADLGTLSLSVLQFSQFTNSNIVKTIFCLKTVWKALSRGCHATIAWNNATITMISGCHSATNLPPRNKRKCYSRKTS